MGMVVRVRNPSPGRGVRYVFLNGLPLGALGITGVAKLVVSRVKPGVLRQLVPLMRGRVEGYIRHPATVELLNRLYGLGLKPSSGLYRYRDGDVLYVVVLKKPIRGTEVTGITEDDIEIYQVEVINR